MLEQFQNSLNNLYEKLMGWLDGLIVALPNIILAAIIMALSIFAARYISKYAKKALSRMLTRNRSIVNLLSNILTIIFLSIMLFVVLGVLNLDKALTSLLAGAGVLGLAVGLALQDPIINTFSGIIMSVKDLCNIGDLVETNGHFGTIERVNLRSTIIRTPTGQRVSIPNKDIVQSPLKNFSFSGERRIDLGCGISYGENLASVKEIALGAIKEGVEVINKNKDVELYYNEFGDSSINFVLRFWISTTSQSSYLAAQSDAVIKLKQAFDDNDIMIPFPIRTLDFGIKGGQNIAEAIPFKQFEKQATNGSASKGEQ